MSRVENNLTKVEYLSKRFGSKWRTLCTKVGSLAAIAVLSPVSVGAYASDPSAKRAVGGKAENFAAQIISDFYHAPPSQRQSYSTMHNGELLQVNYKAKDKVGHGVGSYTLRTLVTKDSHGRPNPNAVNFVLLDENINIGSQAYTFEISKIDNGKNWSVRASYEAPPPTYNVGYTFTTGASSTMRGASIITTSEFTTLAGQAQSDITAATNHTPVGYIVPPLPLPIK